MVFMVKSWNVATAPSSAAVCVRMVAQADAEGKAMRSRAMGVRRVRHICSRPGVHKSGRPLTAQAGDVALFVSDVWHRRLPAGEGDTGRFFLQVHYARRDIAQRVKPTAEVNHLDAAAAARLGNERERRLFGLHPRGFYDG